MTVSGTYNQTTFTVDDIIRRACLRLRIPSAAITAELAQTALDDLWLWMQELTESGIPLWTIEKYIMPLYLGQYIYDLPEKYLDKMGDPVLRTISRAENADDEASSSAGGTVANAFDGELTNVFLQTSPAGYVSYDFGTDFSLSMFGYLAATTDSTLRLTAEYSDDEVTWVTAIATFNPEATDGVWALRDVEKVSAHRYWRLRAMAGTLDCYQLLFGFNSNDTMMGALNRDDYLNQPNKAFQGRPLSYWWDRQRDSPRVHLWPVPNENFMSVVINVRRQLMDVGSLTDTLDLPKRWLSTVVANLALNLVRSGVKHGLDNPADMQLLVGDASATMKKSMGQEEDHMPIRFLPNIRRYTR